MTFACPFCEAVAECGCAALERERVDEADRLRLQTEKWMEEAKALKAERDRKDAEFEKATGMKLGNSDDAVHEAAMAIEIQGRMVDMGIGPNEAWGVWKNHVDWQFEIESDTEGEFEVMWRSLSYDMPEEETKVTRRSGDRHQELEIVCQLEELTAAKHKKFIVNEAGMNVEHVWWSFSATFAWTIE